MSDIQWFWAICGVIALIVIVLGTRNGLRGE